MADLTRRAPPEDDPTVQHEPAPDSGPPEDAEERPHAAPRAEPALGLRRDVDVVAEHHAHSEPLGDRGRERERLVQALDVRRQQHYPPLRVDASGRADPHADELTDAHSRLGRRLGDGDRDVARNVLRAASARRVSPRLADDLPGATGDDGLDLGAPEIDAAAQRGGHRR